MADILTPDLCVIGAGAGGVAAAEAARAYGASVVLVERGKLGGTALNNGAIPARALVAAAAQAQAIRTGAAFGVTAEDPKVNFRRVHDHVDQVIAALAPQQAAPRLEALGVEILAGEAKFSDRRTVTVGETQIRARRFIIATGARPTVPRITGLDGVPYFTTETILDNTRKLTHLVIIGGGSTGYELAQSYCRLGTQVTLVDPGTPLAGFDPELAEIALRRLAEEGVTVYANANVVAIQARSMGIGVAMRSGDTDAMLDVSHILVASERLPNIEALALEQAGIRRDRIHPARLLLTPGLKTSNARVYAVGDVAGGAQSVQSAASEARLVVRSALFGLSLKADPVLVPRLVATDPELAEIGLGEAAARARYRDNFRVTRWSFADNDLARASRRTQGLVKLITDRSGRILGAGIVGSGAGELVALFSLAVASGLNARQLNRFVAPYPSLAEIANRLGDAFERGAGKAPLLQRWMALNRLLG